MKSKFFILVFVLVSMLFSTQIFAEQETESVDWEAFSANLSKAIKSDNAGLQQSAMCMVIRYAENLAIPRDAVFEIVRVFRGDKNENVRLLALVTLHKVEDPWAMDFLRRHRRFEKEARVRKLCNCAVRVYYAKMDSLKAEKTEEILVKATDDLLDQYYATAAEHINLQDYGF